MVGFLGRGVSSGVLRAATAFALLCSNACDPSGITAHPRSTSGGTPGSGGSSSGGTLGAGGSEIFLPSGGGPSGAGGSSCLELTWDSFPGDAGTADAGLGTKAGNDAGEAADAGDAADARGDHDGPVASDARCRAEPLAVPPGQRLDPTHVSVTLSRGDSFLGFIPEVASCEADAGALGFAFDAPASPTALILCPAACDRFRSEPLRITAHFDCTEYGNPW